MSESDSSGSAADGAPGAVEPPAGQGTARGGAASLSDFAALRRREAEQRLLVSLYDAMRDFSDPTRALDRIVELVGRHYGVNRCAYVEIDLHQNLGLVRHDYIDGVPSMAGSYRLADFDAGLLQPARHGQIIVIEDAEQDPRVHQPSARAVFQAIQTRAAILVPLLKDGELATVLTIQERRPRRWTAAEVGLALEIAERTRLAVDNLRGRAELAESRAVLALALRGGRMGAWSYHVASQKMWISAEAEELFGIRPGDFPGTLQAFYDMLHPEDLAAVQRALARSARAAGDHVVEYRCRDQRGIWRWIEARGRTSLGADHQPEFVNGIIIDVTERRAAEQARRESEELFRLALGSSAVPFVVLRALRGALDDRILDFEWLYVNEAAGRVYGAPPEQLIGRSGAHSPLGLWRTQAIFEAYRRVTETRVSERLEVATEIGGTPGWYEMALTPYGDGVAVWFDEITQRKQTEELLRRQAALFEIQGDAIVYIDQRGRILDLNPACERMFGYPRAEMVGRAHTLVHDAGDAAGLTDDIFQALHRRGEWRREIAYLRKDGRRGICETVIRPLLDQARIVGAVAVSRDITERKQAEADLREANLRKDQFLAILAHELRNPLAPMRNAVEILRRRPPADPELLRLRNLVGRQLDHLTRLVDDLLDASRISRGVVELKLASLDLAEAILGAVETVNDALTAAGHTLDLQLPSQPLRVRADSTRLIQIFVNLLSNAIRYTPPHGHIAITSTVAEGWVAVAVRDDGVGIPADKLRGIFEMFSQINPADIRSQGGLGIGLALVRGLVELHGGRVRAESPGPGRGAAFVVELPLAAAGEAREASGATADAIARSPAAAEAAPTPPASRLAPGAKKAGRARADKDASPSAPGAAALAATPGPAAPGRARASAGEDIEPSPQRASAPAGPLPAAGLRILVADDNIDAADSLVTVLLMEGHQAEAAYDGIEAIEAAERLRPHAAIIDLGMPRMDGFAVARHLRTRPWTRDLRLIALSGWGLRADKKRAYDAGFDTHLTKPAVWEDIQRNLPPPPTPENPAPQ